MESLGNKTKTDRGFTLIHFKDDYGVNCSLQESSSVEPHIWLGVDRPAIRILNGNGCGWRDIPISDNALIESWMHLNQKQARLLAQELLFFAEHGDLDKEGE